MRSFCIAIAALAILPGLGSAQVVANPVPVSCGAPSAPLPADHWSRSVLLELHALSVIPASVSPESWPMASRDVACVLEGAAENSGEAGARASRALQRLRSEVPDIFGSAVGAEAGVRRDFIRDPLVAGRSVWEDGHWVYSGPVVPLVEGSSSVYGDIRTSWGVLAADASLEWSGADARLGAGGVTLRAGPVDIRVGRQAFGVGPTLGEPVVLGGGLLWDGVGVATPRAIALPGVLRYIGPVRAKLMLSSMERNGDIESPYFAAQRITFTPLPQVTLGFSRATIFGGRNGPEPLTVRNIVHMLVGLTWQLGHDSSFENQVASGDLTVRLRPGGVPILAHVLWGTEDAGNAFLNVPGWAGGVFVPSLPGAESVSFFADGLYMGGQRGPYPPWYRHGAIGGGWTRDGVLLGHPLGGQGWWARSGMRSEFGSVRISGEIEHANRGPENLFAPDRMGPSWAGSGDALLWAGARTRVQGTVRYERGGGWSEVSGHLGVGVTL